MRSGKGDSFWFGVSAWRHSLAEGIRALLLDSSDVPGAVSEALLMVSARADLVSTLIRPALAAGRNVLCDRYTDSTLAYQGAGRGLDPVMLAGWNTIVTGGLVPDQAEGALCRAK